MTEHTDPPAFMDRLVAAGRRLLAAILRGRGQFDPPGEPEAPVQSRVAAIQAVGILPLPSKSLNLHSRRAGNWPWRNREGAGEKRLRARHCGNTVQFRGLRSRFRQLATITSGGSGPPTLVLLHGYGSSAEQWAPFTQTIRLPSGGRFVFPQAPGLTSPPDGPPGGRGWWRLELASHIPQGDPFRTFQRRNHRA